MKQVPAITIKSACLGEARITSLTDDTKQAKACNSAYAHVRDEVLRAHP